MVRRPIESAEVLVWIVRRARHYARPHMFACFPLLFFDFLLFRA